MSRWAKPYVSDCLVCGREFDHSKKIAKYCTENCKNKAYQRKKKGIPIHEKNYNNSNNH